MPNQIPLAHTENYNLRQDGYVAHRNTDDTKPIEHIDRIDKTGNSELATLHDFWVKIGKQMSGKIQEGRLTDFTAGFPYGISPHGGAAQKKGNESPNDSL